MRKRKEVHWMKSKFALEVNRELTKAIAEGKYADPNAIVIVFNGRKLKQTDVEHVYGYSSGEEPYRATDFSRYRDVPPQYVHYDKREPRQFND